MDHANDREHFFVVLEADDVRSNSVKSEILILNVIAAMPDSRNGSELLNRLDDFTVDTLGRIWAKIADVVQDIPKIR